MISFNKFSKHQNIESDLERGMKLEHLVQQEKVEDTKETFFCLKRKLHVRFKKQIFKIHFLGFLNKKNIFDNETMNHICRAKNITIKQ